MAKPKGAPKTGGRQKGTPNKTTAGVKAALEAAFEGLGGVPALLRWGREEPGEFYKLWAKMLPTEIKNELTGKDGAPLAPMINVTVKK